MPLFRLSAVVEVPILRCRRNARFIGRNSALVDYVGGSTPHMGTHREAAGREGMCGRRARSSDRPSTLPPAICFVGKLVRIPHLLFGCVDSDGPARALHL